MLMQSLYDPRHVKSLLVPFAKRIPWPEAGDPAWQQLPESKKQVISEWSDRVSALGYPMVTATQFMAYRRTGDRKLHENPFFERRRTLIGAAAGECLAHDDARLDAVIDGLWCICEETYWGLSAHNGDWDRSEPYEVHCLPDKYDPYIDLFAAQTAVDVSLTLRLLQSRLDEQDTRIAARVRREVEERIFTPFLTHRDMKWMGIYGQPLNNWTPWIVSSVLYTAAALMEDDTCLSVLIAKAAAMLDRWLDQMPDDGGLDEGVAYWNMAGGAFLDCLECLRTVSGGRIDYYGSEKVKRIFNFPRMSYIGDGWFFNFADCDARPPLDGERIYTCGLRTNQPELMALGASRGCEIIPPDTAQMNRTLDAIFTQLPQLTDPGAPERIAYDHLQVWGRSQNGMFAVVKGGHNDESHNHNDVGSLIVFADRQPVLIDAGNAVYTRFTFSEERYSLWHIRSMNHNVPMIGDFEQQAGREYRAADVHAGTDTVSMDIAAAYPAEAGVTGLRRTVQLTEPVTLTDTVTLSREQPVTWVLMSRPEPRQTAPGVIRLGPCVLRYPAELRFACEAKEIADPRMSRVYPGRLWRMTFTTPAALRHEAVFSLKREE